MSCGLSHINVWPWVLVHLPETWITCLCKQMFPPLAAKFARGQGTFVCISKKPLFVGGSKPRSCTVSSFYPSLYLCVSILHVLIAPRPFTPTVSNGIACRGHRLRSRSRKCTVHVCANWPIDALLAPVSGRIEPSAVLFLSRPHLGSLKVLEIELKHCGLESITSVFNNDSNVSPVSMPGADLFKQV